MDLKEELKKYVNTSEFVDLDIGLRKGSAYFVEKLINENYITKEEHEKALAEITKKALKDIRKSNKMGVLWERFRGDRMPEIKHAYAQVVKAYRELKAKYKNKS
jgi:F0F1-type ATP synthase delta subunit